MESKNLNKNLSVIITSDCQPYSIIENERFLKIFPSYETWVQFLLEKPT